MKNRNTISLIIGLIVVVAALLIWLRRGEETSMKSGKAQTKISPVAISPPLLPTAPSAGPSPFADPMAALLKTPIQFYGLVLDQAGNPVAGAKAAGSVLDDSVRGKSPISITSDASGRFSIQTRGRSLYLEVSKPGYYRINQEGKLKPSYQSFDFGLDTGRGIHRSDPASPDVFQLLKAGNPVVLERLVAQPRVPRDGSPMSVRISKKSNVALRIRCHTVAGNGLPNARYDWKCELDVEGGGIQEALDEYEFTAPEGGYAASAVIDMPKSLGVKIWNSRVIKSYWLRFPDNTFAKVQFDMHTRGEHYANIEGFRSPTPNDRNLEPHVRER